MRRSTRFAPFSRLALLAAIGALGVTTFAPAARAADAAKPAAEKAAPAAVKAGPGAAPADKAAASAKPAAAKAPDKKTRDAARKAYGEGEKAFAAGDFSAAHTGYAKANELIPSAHAAYWAAKSLDQGGKTDDAIKAYEALLADPGASKIGDDKLGDAQTRLATLKASLVGEITVSTLPATATVSVDGVAQPGPPPVVLKLAPGPHKLGFTAEGFDAKEVDLQVQAGTKVEQKVELQQHAALLPPLAAEPVVAPAPLPPPPEPEKHSKVPAYVTLGIAAGGAIVGTIFGVQALQSKSDFDKTPTTKSADDTERNALIADMAFGVAVTLGVTGIVLLTSSDDAPDAPKAATLHLPPKSTFRVVPYVGRESGGAAARLTF
jgi:tetratricopeptide (TPR) repeat protein